MSFSGAIIQIRRNTEAGWQATNPVLRIGEQGFESDTGRIRIGNGEDRFLDLDYYIPSNQILELINQSLLEAGAGDGGAAYQLINARITDHIQSLTPHPAYDDGPSLLLLYENAKV